MAAKSSILPLILAALVGGGITFFLSQLQFNLWIEPPSKEVPPVIDVGPPPQVNAPAPSVQTAANGLRVSNISPNAVRVVLLSHQSKRDPTAVPYRSPVHWDFAPKEGSQEGLLLSLPEGSLTLMPGDVLVAFALDGSRHYWGPYVIGETQRPTRTTSSEWQLVLSP